MELPPALVELAPAFAELALAFADPSPAFVNPSLAFVELSPAFVELSLAFGDSSPAFVKLAPALAQLPLTFLELPPATTRPLIVRTRISISGSKHLALLPGDTTQIIRLDQVCHSAPVRATLRLLDPRRAATDIVVLQKFC